MELRIDPSGRVQCLYGEAIDLRSLGSLSIRRASHVEPDENGNWWADLAPVRLAGLEVLSLSGAPHDKKLSDLLVSELRVLAADPEGALLVGQAFLDGKLPESLRSQIADALRRHADMVCAALRGCLPRRELTSAMLLPDGCEREVDAGFVGVLGAFEVYRGSARGHRMANLRVILR